MGLDITCYSRLTKIKDATRNEDGEWIDNETGKEIEWDTYVDVYPNPSFPDRCELEEGPYRYYDQDCFRTGNYGGYNHWRDKLAELAEYELTEQTKWGGEKEMTYSAGAWAVDNGPFWELIFFADDEGTIGTKVSAKLAKDFEEYQELADKHADERWRESYAEWRAAFEMAADGGCVDFH